MGTKLGAYPEDPPYPESTEPSSCLFTGAPSSNIEFAIAVFSHCVMYGWFSSKTDADIPTSSSSRRSSTHTSSDSKFSATVDVVTTEPSRNPARTSAINLLSRFSIRAVEELQNGSQQIS